MGKTIVKYLGHNEGHMISKLEENLGDTDIKNFTVSPLYQIKVRPTLSSCLVRRLRSLICFSPIKLRSRVRSNSHTFTTQFNLIVDLMPPC